MRLDRFNFFLALAVLSGCSQSAPEPAAAAERPVVVTTATAKSETHPTERWLPGTVRPTERGVLAARMMGRVIDADFEVGTEVEAGQVLLRLEAPELAARVAQAEAALSRIERDHAREQALLEKNATTSEAVNALADGLREAEARLEEARALMADTTLTAPFAGVITRKTIQSGDLATPGTPLLTLEGTDHFEIRLGVPASLPPPAPKSLLRVFTNAEEITARVVAFSPAVDARSRTWEAILRPLTGDPRSGAFVRVAWPDAPLAGLWIPPEALHVVGQMEQVFVVENGIARMRLVKTGVRVGNRIQIHAGLREGERVILTPPVHLRDGQAVEVRP